VYPSAKSAMIAPWASPVTVSGPRLSMRPETFTHSSRCEEAGATGDIPRSHRLFLPSPRSPVRLGCPTGSGLRNLPVWGDGAVGTKLEGPHLDEGRVQLAYLGELVGVGDALVLDAVDEVEQLLRCGVAGVDPLQEDVRGVEAHVAVGAGVNEHLLE